MVQQKAERLFHAAQKIAEQIPDFFETKGPGRGDRATADFMDKLRKVAEGIFGQDYSEKKACDDANFIIDFYFPDEATAVEIALGLDKPLSEYERDIFKCLLARESGCQVTRLVFISKPGASQRQSAPGPKAIADLVKRHFGLQTEILELASSTLQ